MPQPTTPRVYMSNLEIKAMLEELLKERFSPEFHRLDQSMLEILTRLGSLTAMLESRAGAQPRARSKLS